MEWIPDYINGKHGKIKPKYLHPKLEPILNITYGVAIYQEQVMQMARDLAGFTMGEADVLRKAVGKKIVKLLAEQKEKFIDGCVKNGISAELAAQIFAFIEPFAGYGFNRSHAACYAMIGYQTAYLKANWPTEFMAALLIADQDDVERIAVEIDEARKMGIKVLPPDVNESFDSFTVVTSGTKTGKIVGPEEKVDTIRFGLKAIKNFGGHIAEAIVAERKLNGPFADLTDLLERVTDKDLNKKSLESAIKSGAMDLWGDRGILLANIENILAFSKEIGKGANSRQTSLFSMAPKMLEKQKVRLDKPSEFTQQEKLSWEKELLGLYISEHPFNEFRKIIGDHIVPLSRLKEASRDMDLITAGVVIEQKKIITRAGDAMLFVKIEDQVQSVECLVFPRTLKENPDAWLDGRVVLIHGRVSDKDAEVKLLVNKAQLVTLENAAVEFRQFVEMTAKLKPRPKFFKKEDKGVSGNKVVADSLVVKENPLKIILNPSAGQELMNQLRELFVGFKGEDKVYFRVTLNGEKKVIETGFRVTNSEELQTQVQSLGGEQLTIAN
jgi:DNA polymerase-3 subunit alpha